MTNHHSNRTVPAQEVQHDYQAITPTLLAIRHATVHTSAYPPLKINTNAGAWRPVPWINLKGLWLQHAGFNTNQPYTIEVFQNRLILTIRE